MRPHIYISALIFSIIIQSSFYAFDFQPDTVEKYKFLLMEWNISSYTNFFMLAVIGFTGVAGFLCLFGAYNIGSPASIAPFEYVIILWAILISWFLWGEILDGKAYIGLIFIIFASLIICSRELLIIIIRRQVDSSSRELLSVSFLGKCKTAFQMIAIGVLIISPFLRDEFYILSIILLMTASVLSIYSFFDYLVKLQKKSKVNFK